jgi:hypothetical protein
MTVTGKSFKGVHFGRENFRDHDVLGTADGRMNIVMDIANQMTCHGMMLVESLSK